MHLKCYDILNFAFIILRKMPVLPNHSNVINYLKQLSTFQGHPVRILYISSTILILMMIYEDQDHEVVHIIITIIWYIYLLYLYLLYYIISIYFV